MSLETEGWSYNRVNTVLPVDCCLTVLLSSQVDRLYDWKRSPETDVVATLKKQKKNTKDEFDERVKAVIVEFAQQVSIIPLSTNHSTAFPLGAGLTDSYYIYMIHLNEKHLVFSEGTLKGTYHAKCTFVRLFYLNMCPRCVRNTKAAKKTSHRISPCKNRAGKQQIEQNEA